MSVKKEWFFKFISNKKSDIDNSNHSITELISFINLFFKKYGLQASNLKLYYNKYNLKLFVSYNLIDYIYNKSSFSIKLEKYTSFSVEQPVINSYLKYKYLAILFHSIGDKIKVINKSFIYNKLSIPSIIFLFKSKYLSSKQALFVNLFLSKLTVTINLFLNYKKSSTLVFQPLFKNTGLNICYYLNKNYLIFNVIRLRKFNWLVSHRTVLNLVYSSLKLSNKTTILSNILSFKLPIVKGLKHIGNFLKYLETVCILLLLRSAHILGLKIILTGNITKNQRATKLVTLIGQHINNSKINENITYDTVTCFTVNGTLGIKVLVKS